jgi:hypothetical protein
MNRSVGRLRSPASHRKDDAVAKAAPIERTSSCTGETSAPECVWTHAVVCDSLFVARRWTTRVFSASPRRRGRPPPELRRKEENSYRENGVDELPPLMEAGGSICPS